MFRNFDPQSLLQIIDSAPAGMAFSDTDRVYRFVNQHYEKFLGLSREEIIGKRFSDIVPKNSDVVNNYHDRVLKGEEVKYEVDIQYEGRATQFHIIHKPVYDNDSIIGYITYGIEQSETRQFLEKQAALFSALPSWVIVINRDFIVQEVHNEERLAFPKEFIMNKNIFDPEVTQDPEHRSGGQMAAEKAFREGEGYFDYFWAPENVHLRASYRRLGENEVMITTQNITSLKQEMEYKEALINEIHHRVKNNFYVIDSLLSLELRNSQIPEASDVLLKVRSRLQNMSRLHEVLYIDSQLKPVALDSLMSKLTSFLTESDMKLTYENTGNVMVDTERAIALGSILSELVTNSIKEHLKNPLEAYVITSYEDGIFQLCYYDTGSFYRIDAQVPESQSGLGLQLIKIFAQKIGAAITYIESDELKDCCRLKLKSKQLDKMRVFQLKCAL